MADQSRSWIITLPADEFTQETVESKLKKYTYMGQLELGASGYKHWQIYIENKGPIKFDTLRSKFPKGHFEKRQGSRRQAADYVSKEETSQGIKISNGVIDVEVDDDKSTKLTEIRDQIIYEGKTLNQVVMAESADVVSKNMRYLEKVAEAADEVRFSRELRDIEVHYIYGAAGVGKTSGIYNQFGFDQVYRVNDYDHPFDSYERQDVLVLDEYYSQVKFSLMLNVLDRYPLRLPARYRDRWAGFTKVYIVSNVSLKNQYINVQETNREGWKALLRRITTVKEMVAPGVLEDRTHRFKDVEPITDISYSM